MGHTKMITCVSATEAEPAANVLCFSKKSRFRLQNQNIMEKSKSLLKEYRGDTKEIVGDTSGTFLKLMLPNWCESLIGISIETAAQNSALLR